MKYFVYILECADKTLYTGYTNDLLKRELAHNNSKLGAKYTMARRPVRLVYFEKFETKSEALKREVVLKKMTRKQKFDIISK